MDRATKKLRLASCVKTIIEVHSCLFPKQPDQYTIKKFEQLKKTLDKIVLDELSEGDIRRIEEATNQVLTELGLLYAESAQNLDYLGPKH